MGFVDSLKEVKEIEMELYPNVDRSKVDGTFYYDESNNFRKFRLNETGFNNDISDQSHFTLGGIYLPKGCKPDVEDLMIKLRPQKNQKELKFKFFSYGKKELKDFLKSKILKILFEWIFSNEILIHMSSMDYLYFSIVDIIDELPDAKSTGLFNKSLKDILYEVVRKDIKSFVDILYRYKYTNIKKEVIFDFYKEVYRFYINYYEYDNFDPNDFSKELLRQMLKSGFRREGNGFLENNDEYVLHEHYEMIYVNTPANFPKCNHIFDEEPDIIEKLEKLESEYSDLLNMKFKKSETDVYIQLSDAIAGFSARLDTMIFNNDFSGITAFVSSLELNQVKLIHDYLKIVVKSDGFCILFTHSTVPEIYRSKYSHLWNEVIERLQNKQ